jgi:hypothetical protein
MEKAKTIAVNLAVIALLSVLLIWGNTWYRQWRQFNRGEQALAGNNVIAAIAGYESAIHMYTPFSPLVERSAERLWEIARRCEAKGDHGAGADLPLPAQFIYAVRGSTSQGKEWIRAATRRSPTVKTEREMMA